MMTPLLDLEMMKLLARQDPLQDEAWATYCINAATIIVTDTAGHADWRGEDSNGNAVTLVPAPRRVQMIAEQLAKRAYLNPDAIKSEGSIGPIGGDSTVEDFARTFELTPAEALVLADYAAAATGSSGLFVINISVRPPTNWGDILLPDLDPRADPWLVGTEGESWAYGTAP